MSIELALSGFSILVTLALGVLYFFNQRRSNRTSEKKLTVDEQIAEDEREDVIARRRKEELERLYPRLEALEEAHAELRDRFEAAVKMIGIWERQAMEMIHHIVLLEEMVPNPPGPPTRPDWKLPLLTDRADP